MPKATKSKSPSLKQATLAFNSSKRTASITSGKGGKAAPTISKQQSTIEIDSSSEEEIEDDILSEDEAEAIESAEKTEKDTPAISQKASVSIVNVTRPRTKAPNTETKKFDANGLPELKLDDPRWRKPHREAQAKRDFSKLIHAEGETKIHDILRVFDLSYEYGPCVGMTRLDRWERAFALGLDPPGEIRDILTTRQGAKEPYSQSVFYEAAA
ncbi:DNA polymerase delta, subunit 4-domain-containing protein [Mycena rebaudengoi]|nr:DNA polymerase delta, subunit 4-domain-containing protein [Mycena rebaudengoi]